MYWGCGGGDRLVCKANRLTINKTRSYISSGWLWVASVILWPWNAVEHQNMQSTCLHWKMNDLTSICAWRTSSGRSLYRTSGLLSCGLPWVRAEGGVSTALVRWEGMDHVFRGRGSRKKRQGNNRKLKKEWAKGRKETLKKKNLAWRSLKIVN